MFDAVETPSRRGVLTTGVVAVSSVVLDAGTSGLVVLPVGPPLDPVLGLAAPLALLGGIPAVVGLGIGATVTALLRWSLTWLTLVELLSVGALGGASYGLWGRLPVIATGENPPPDSLRQAVEFATVSLVASVTAVCLLAWGGVLVQSQVFHGVVLTELPIVLWSTLLCGVVVMLPAGLVSERLRFDVPERTPLSRGDGAFWGMVLVPVLWLVLGSLFSIAATIVQSIGGNTLREYGYGYVFVVFDPGIVGESGRGALVVLGAMLLAIVVITWLPRNRKNHTTATQTGSPES